INTLTEHWDGNAWKIVASPSPAPSFGFGNDTLLSVSCAVANSCMAVGSVGSDPLIERWNGTKWAVSTGVKPANGAALDGVACVSATSCFAVGTKVTEQFSNPAFIERWNGTTWSPSASPDKGGYRDALQAVACADVNTCTAVGYVATLSGHE